VSANAEPPEASAQASPGLADLSEQIASARAQSAPAQPDADRAGPHAQGAGEANGATAAASSRRPWPDHIGVAMGRMGTALSRPPVRLAATGVVLLLIAILLVPSSVWTLPLAIVGALMVLIAWIGSRLRGHVRVEWGETGARVDFHAEVAAARHRSAVPAAQRRPVIAAVPERDDDNVIEGEAHTVEIDLGELKALIAAAEADGGDSAASSSRGRLRRR
jgi:hypothetical protein